MLEDNKNLFDTIMGDIDEPDLEENVDFLKEQGLVEMYSPIIADIKAKFEESERARSTIEHQMLKNVAAYRGKDGTDSEKIRNSEKSKVYVRTTAVKVKAAYAQIIEAVFADGNYPIQIASTHVPEGVSEFAHLKTDMAPEPMPEPEAPQAPEDGIGFEGDGFDLQPGSTAGNAQFLGGLHDEFTDEEGNTVLEEGKAKQGEVQINVAKELARRMQRVIHDQLDETKANTEIRKTIFEMCLLGTGAMKGPFNVNKTLHKWDIDQETGQRQYIPEVVQTCRSSMVSVWNLYPDPNATKADEMEWCIERHKMNSSQMRQLKKRPHFDDQAIDRLLDKGIGNYVRKGFEHTLSTSSTSESEGRLYEVLEYWGYMDRERLIEFNLPTDEMLEDLVQVNVWVCANEVLRVVVNPFLPQRIPYYIIPYETDPYSLWGTGVPEVMEDSQAMMNGFTRLAIDNLALAGNLVFDIDESMMVAGQDMEIYPGKIFRRQAGGAGQALYAQQFPNTAPANMQMFKEFRQLADESTGIPSFAHGQTGVTSPTRTASGMSMLLQNASLNIKTVIRNLDDFLFKPKGEAYYRWNMQFNTKVDIKGDLEVRATGSSSLQAKEVRSTRLNSFLQMAANPALAPLIKLPTVLKEFAMTMDIDPDEILNSPEEAEIYARLMGTQQMQPQQGPQGSEGMQLSAPAPTDPSFTGNDMSSGGEMAQMMAGQQGL